jgi:hypothetical protein
LEEFEPPKVETTPTVLKRRSTIQILKESEAKWPFLLVGAVMLAYVAYLLAK